MKLQEIKVPSNLACPHCNAPITNAAVTRGKPGVGFQKGGTIILCSRCATVLRVGDSGLELATPAYINSLSQQAKEAILATRLTLIRLLQKSGKTVDIKSETGL